MSEDGLASVEGVAQALQEAGYTVAAGQLAGEQAVLAETPYALVGCVELVDWDGLEERVFDIQAALTRVAEEAPSALAWDLYLITLLRTPPPSPAAAASVEAIENDTRYTRKFVHAALPADALDRALRPLLPLRAPVAISLGDPLEDLLNELFELDVDERVARTAVQSFKDHDAVEIR
jgi:hypothetical protein